MPAEPMDFLHAVFWASAATYLTIALALRIRFAKPAARRPSQGLRALAAGQRKDLWFACGIAWLGVLAKPLVIRDAAYVVCAAILGWLCVRAGKRWRALGSHDSR